MSGRPWRVLHVITRLDRGGSADNTLLTVLGMDRRRFAADLAAGPITSEVSSLFSRVQDTAARIFTIPTLERRIAPGHDLRALVSLWRLLRRGRYDIVHTHTSKAGLVGRLAARMAHSPVVIHTPHGHVFYGYHGVWATRLFVALERWAAGSTDRIVALTQREVNDYAKLSVAPPERCVAIHSGVDFAPFDAESRSSRVARQELGIPRDACVIGTLGRLTAVKGQEDLLQAFAGVSRHHDQLWLLLVGDGEERGHLEARARELGVAQRMIVSGWRGDVPFLLRAMDVFAFPSHNEGMGKALVEAMYCGLPVVATSVGGVPEIVADGVHGVLVPAGQVAALEAGLLRLVGDAAQRREMGTAARRRAAEFSVQRMIAKLEGLYEELVHDQRMA